MRLLLSMCNLGVFNSQFSLGRVEVAERGKVDLIDCRSFINPEVDAGINGLCAVPGGIAVTVQSHTPRVVLLDPDLKISRKIEHPALSDLHSLHMSDGRLFCVCTGNNKILEINPQSGEASVFWEYHIDQPCLHINSIGFKDGRAVVASHSLPAEAPVRNRGGVWYLDSYETVMSGLLQPHSLSVSDAGVITCLSSHDSRVVICNGETTVEKQVHGYLRGMVSAGDQIYIASSSKRFVSRKQQGVHVYVDFEEVVGNRDFMSSLVVCDSDFRQVKRINTTHLGFEVYDVIVDPGIPDTLVRRPTLSVRLQTMFRQNVFFREQLYKVRKAVEQDDEVL